MSDYDQQETDEQGAVLAESASGDTAATSPDDDTTAHRSVQSWSNAAARTRTGMEEAIRAAAERFWPSYPTVGFSGAEDRQHAFIAGVRWAREQTAPTLPDPHGGCTCTPHSQDAGSGHTEHPLEYSPACPEHSEHVYNPRTGVWDFAPTVAPDVATIASVIAEHGSLASIPDVGTECECGQVINGPDEFYETRWRTHQAEAVVAADPRRTEAEVKAEALEEAATVMQDGIGEPWNPSTTDYEQQRHEAKARRRWLRERAAQLRDEADQ